MGNLINTTWHPVNSGVHGGERVIMCECGDESCYKALVVTDAGDQIIEIYSDYSDKREPDFKLFDMPEGYSVCERVPAEMSDDYEKRITELEAQLEELSDKAVGMTERLEIENERLRAENARLRANGQLVKAAPDLLNACELALKYIEGDINLRMGYETDGNRENLASFLADAIAQARPHNDR